MTGLGSQITRLAQHSAIYGLGGLVSRFVALLLLPLYTRYLTPADYGAVETLVALAAILATVLRLGIASAFFRFYFDSADTAHRLRVVRTSFWFTMTMATLGLVAGLVLAEPISNWLFDTGDHTTLVRVVVRPALGTDELRADDEPLPRGGASGRLHDRDAREPRAHRRGHGPVRRRLRLGSDRRRSRQLHAARSSSTQRCSSTATSSSA